MNASSESGRRHHNLGRLLAPRSVAIVGASETRSMSNNAVRPMLRAGLTPYLVTPIHKTLYDRPTVPSLTAIGHPVDAVMSLVSAERAIEIVEEAGGLGCGGVAVIAGGFSEAGPEGAALEKRLIEASRIGEIAVIGPNCAGFVNVPLQATLFIGGELELIAGGIAIIAQSGFLARAAMAAAARRRLGVNIAISSGNETVCDLSEQMDVLTDDAATRVVCLAIEKLRQPERFFSAVARARKAGKPVVALKLGQTARARSIMQAHTGAIADDGWIYDVAFRQAGVLIARDIDDLIDQAAIFEQLPRTRWTPIERLAVVTTSGGGAELVADLSDQEGIALPELPELSSWLRDHGPGDSNVNPLDMSVYMFESQQKVESLFERYGSAEGADAALLSWWCAPNDKSWAHTLAKSFAVVAERSSRPFILTSLETEEVGAWTDELRSHGLVIYGGLRSAARGARAMTAYTAPRRLLSVSSSAIAPLPRPLDATTVPTPMGPMLSFGATLDLLRLAGLPVAPCVLIDSADQTAESIAGLSSLLVVKLANLPHRTEYDAVRVGVEVTDAPRIVRELQALARRENLDPQVAVQPLVGGIGEAFVGLKATKEFGPLVMFGLGGILVELLRKVSGRLLPIDAVEAEQLLLDVGADTVFAGLRGRAPWHRASLVELLTRLSTLGERTSGWIETLEFNPVICSESDCTIVDAVCILKSKASAPS